MSDTGDIPDSKREVALISWIQQFAPYGVITLDKSLRVQSWNHWMEQHSGLRVEQVAGQELLTLFPAIGERKLVSPFERALSGESSVLSTALHQYLLPFPSSLPNKDFELMRQTVRVMPLLSNAVVCGVIVVIEDVTQREIQAETLRRRHRRDEILSWALAHLLKSEEPRKTVRQLFFKIAEHLDFDTFLLYLRDVETESLNLYTTGGVAPDAEKNFAVDPLLIAIAEGGEMIVLSSVKANSNPDYAILKQAGISAAIAIPLLANERSLGLLCFATWSRESIDAEESDLLTTIAQYLATAVDRENTKQQLEKAQADLFNHSQLLEKKVEERTSRLQETISELETFSYTLAHDLKAPVRGMTGYCRVLIEDYVEKLPGEANQIVRKMLRASRRMETLIHDLLAFSRISRENVVLSVMEIEPILDDVLALREATVRQAITIHAPLHRVQAHRALLQQVLSNLVDNAVKFVPARALPKIDIYSEEVGHSSPNTRLTPLIFSSNELATPTASASALETKPRQVRIWIQDEGIGIPSEAHQKIFGIFERGVTSEIYEGTGMGLAIVARAMQRMGGKCGVESELGAGSRFWIELPADEEPLI